jgi:hypothetical protein
MAYEQKPGQFALFKNDKEGIESRPDYVGDGVDLDGTPIRVACWIKPMKNGGKFMACNIQSKDAPRQEKPKDRSRPQDDDDGIPF